jgi:AcrR family transcriptional regulator
MESAPRYDRQILDKRAAILEAACALFAERGFYGTTVPEVAARAGVGAGTVYRYFESKEALVNELYQERKTELGRALLEGLDSGTAPRRQFRELWQRMSEFTRRHPDTVSFLELHHHAPYLDEASRRCEEEIRSAIVSFIEGLQRREVIKAVPPDLIMVIVYGAFVGLAKAIRAGQLERSPAIIEAAETCVWEAIRR